MLLIADTGWIVKVSVFGEEAPLGDADKRNSSFRLDENVVGAGIEILPTIGVEFKFGLMIGQNEN